MEGIKKEVIDLLDEKLMDYIIEDTRHLISAFEDHVSKKDYDVFSKYDKFIEKIQNVIELSFKYVKKTEKTISCDVAWILLDLNDLKKVIRNCDYKFEEYDDFFEEPQLVMDLDSFIHDTASGYLIQREHYFSVDDVLAYKNKMEAEIESTNERIKKNKEKREKYVNDKKGIVEEWLKDHVKIDFDCSILSVEETKILRDALNTELKSISLSLLQRKYGMGFARAVMIVEHLEDCGAISTVEEAKEMGLEKSEQIVLVRI